MPKNNKPSAWLLYAVGALILIGALIAAAAILSHGGPALPF